MSEEELYIGLDELGSLMDDVDALLEQATSFAQVGKFSAKTSAMIWDEVGGMREADAKTWKSHTGFKFLNLHVMVDTQEFNPDLDKSYERRIQIKQAPWNRKEDDGSYTRIPADWEAIFEPSLFKAAGVKGVAKALKALTGKYVKVLDVRQQPTKRQPEPEYNTAKIEAVYDSREEAFAAYNALRGSASESSEVVESAPKYPADKVAGVKKLFGLGVKDPEVIAKEAEISVEAVNDILGSL